MRVDVAGIGSAARFGVSRYWGLSAGRRIEIYVKYAGRRTELELAGICLPDFQGGTPQQLHDIGDGFVRERYRQIEPGAGIRGNCWQFQGLARAAGYS